MTAEYVQSLLDHYAEPLKDWAKEVEGRSIEISSTQDDLGVHVRSRFTQGGNKYGLNRIVTHQKQCREFVVALAASIDYYCGIAPDGTWMLSKIPVEEGQ